MTWNNVKKIAGRVVAVIVPVAMQFLWYLLILKWLSKAAGLLSIVLTVLSFLFVLYINTKREESSYKTRCIAYPFHRLSKPFVLTFKLHYALFPVRKLIVHVKLDSAEYFSVGEEMFADMCKELEKAEKYIFAEYFILQNGKFLNTVVDIMARKAAQVVIHYPEIGRASCRERVSSTV